jgi:hypothetical protein
MIKTVYFVSTINSSKESFTISKSCRSIFKLSSLIKSAVCRLPEFHIGAPLAFVPCRTLFKLSILLVIPVSLFFNAIYIS